MTLNSKRGILTEGLSVQKKKEWSIGGDSEMSDDARTRNVEICREWVSEVICRVLDIGFFKSHRIGSLERVAEEEPLDSEEVDSILWNIFKLDSTELPDGFDVLVYSSDCLARVERELRELRESGVESAERGWKVAFVNRLKRVVLMWLTLTLELPNMFPSVSVQLMENPLIQARTFVNLVYRKRISQETVDFIVDQIELDSGQKTLEEFFSKVFWEITTCVRAKNAYCDEYVLLYEALRSLMRNAKLAKLLVHLPNWLPEGAAAEDIIRRTYIGPFLLLDTFCDYDHSGYANANHMSQLKKHETIFRCQGIISDVVDSLLSNPDCRSRMLDWFAQALQIHKHQTNILEEVEYFTISDSFLVTISSCLLSRCAPYSCVRNKKYLQIDPEYFFKSERIKSVIDQSCTRLAVESVPCKHWTDGRLEAMSRHPSAFMSENSELYVFTECFYLGLVALNLSYNLLYPKIRILDRKQKNLEYYFHEYELESESILEYYSRLEYEKIASTIRLTDSRLVLPIFYFWELTGTWLVRLSQSRIERDAPMPLNLAEEDNPQSVYRTDGLAMYAPVSMALKIMPEFIVDSFANFFQWAREYWPDYRRQSFSNVVSIALTFFSSPEYLCNPFLRRKLVNLLIFLTPKYLDFKLEKDPFDSEYVVNNLGPSLSGLYVGSSKTDASFPNFELRHNLSMVFVPAWKGRAKAATIQFWESNPDHSVAFCNILICDLIHFLDEALVLFTEAFNVSAQSCCLIFSERAQKAKELVKKANFYLSLAEEGLRFMYKLCRDSAHLFMQGRLTETLGTMLNTYIYQHCATRCKILQIERSKTRFFKPKWLLKKTCMIMLFLYAKFPSLADVLAKDQRCLSENMYSHMRRIVKERRIMSPSYFAILDKLVDDVERIAKRNKFIEEHLGDIPEEFLDAITSNLMKDPVQLPESRVIVDRSTIQRYLLSFHVDPFNRQPLQADQVISLPHLLKRIEDFVSSRIGA